jgi:perosamine synthetase
VGLLEEELAEYLDASYVRAVSSCTSALICAVVGLGIGEGDEVITTPLSFAASTNCILFNRAKPIFADISLGNGYCLDPQKVAEAVTKRTRAILAVHYGGFVADMPALSKIAEDNGLLIIEDAAHALGAMREGKMAGTFGDAGCLSFHPVKHIAAGEGGALVTENHKLARFVELYRSQGLSTSTQERQVERKIHHYDVEMLGYNLRMSDIHARLAREQLKRQVGFLNRRRELAKVYDRAFSDHQGIIPPPPAEKHGGSYHLYPVRMVPERWRIGRDELLTALRAEGIGATLHYPPIHLLKYHRQVLGYAPGDFPKAELAGETLLSLPLFPKMSDEDQKDVIAGMDKLWQFYKR